MSQTHDGANDPFGYRPPWYLRSGHLQTLITGFYRPRAALPPAIVHRIPIEPWGHMLVHENAPEGDAQAQPRAHVLLLHGLGSSHAGTYMTNIAHELLAAGCRVFRADLPGAGPSGKTTPLPPHGACYGLVRACLVHLSRELAIPRWRLAGVSLGGNILLRLLAEEEEALAEGGEAIEIESTVAVAPPIDLDACCQNMESGPRRMYARYFMRALRQQAQQRAEWWPEWRERMPHADYSTIRRFDATVTAPLAGFRDADAYYAAGSSLPLWEKIRVPTTLLIDEHDPIVPVTLFDRLPHSESVRVVRTAHGGHVGYLQRNPAPRSTDGAAWHRWADAWIARAILESPR